MIWFSVMDIIFYGHTQGQRVMRLAQLLGDSRHSVAVLRPKQRDFAQIRRIGNVQLLYGSSFNPEKPGGWMYLFLAMFKIWRRQPEVVHMFGWRAAALSRLLMLFVPETTIVWTVDTIPFSRMFTARWIARSAQRVCDAISTPTRQVQYQLLTQFGVRAGYIPDGYDEPQLADVPAKYWGLGKGQYVVTTAARVAAIAHVAECYRQVDTKKKLVVMIKSSAAVERLKRKYRFLKVIEPLEGRSLHSLLRNAAVVVATERDDSYIALLQAMDGGGAIIAVNHPLHQELLGTAAQFVSARDVEGLRDMLSSLVPSVSKQKLWGEKARKRAKTHFEWQGLLDEYVSLYHYPLVRLVPVDSVMRKPQFRTRAFE